MVKFSMACSLQKCLGQLCRNDDFSDFTIIIEDKKYQCHRFILRACSRFFDGLLRSEMRENIAGSVELFGMTADTFDVIINSVYRGIDGLTQENVVIVWKAVHQLQIDYMITECEDFVMCTMSLNNYLKYYDCTKLLQSEKVVKFSFDFMINNFNHFRDTQTFLDLTADELYRMVESHNLNIASEELVIESILRWVSRLSIDKNVDKDNDRVKDLVRLLSVARVCLLRPDYLQTLKEHPVICTNLEATNVLSKAALYQQSFQHDYWPHSAVHRSCSDMTHVMVFVDGFTNQCKFYSLENGSTHILCQLPIDYQCTRPQLTLAVSDQALFLGESFENDVYKWISHIYHWEKSSGWSVSVHSLDTRIEKFLTVNQQTYMIATNSDFSSDRNNIHLGNVLLNPVSVTFPDHINEAFLYKENIILLAELRENEYEVDYLMNVLECYNSTTKKRSRLKHLKCQFLSTVSFCCGENVYTLQGDSILCLVISVKDKADNRQSKNDKVLFQFVAKLWDFWMRPYGAVVYKDEIFIFGSETDNSKTWKTFVPGNSDFKTIKIIQIDSTSTCHPMTVPKSWLKFNPVSPDSVLKNVSRSWCKYTEICHIM